ncbi:MAG: nucleotidyltransferase domain-containing protein [Bacteroidota bacterium]
MNNLELLNEIKEKLLLNFPGIIEKVVLFGSQAKGNALDDSDYDILVIVGKNYDWQLKNKLIDLIYDFDLKYNIFTDVKIISKEELNTVKGKQPFIQNALEFGIIV